MKNKIIYKKLALVSLMIYVISPFLNYSANKDKGKNFKVWVVSNESYNCTKYKWEESCTTKTKKEEDGTEKYNCHDVDEYKTEKKCKTVNLPDICEDVDDYEEKEVCTTGPSTKKKGKCNGWNKKTVKYNCHKTPRVCVHTHNEAKCKKVKYFDPNCPESTENDTAGCYKTKYECENNEVCDSWSGGYEKCDTKTVKGSCNSWTTITVPGKKTCKKEKTKIGSHKKCTSGGTKEECTDERVKSGSHRECDTRTKYKDVEYEDCTSEFVPYSTTCTQDSSHWEALSNIKDADINSIVKNFNSYAIVYKNDVIKISDIVSNNSSIVRILSEPNTSSLGEKDYEIIVRVNGKDVKVKGKALVIDKPSLEYKDVRTGVINETVSVENVLENLIPSTNRLNKDRYKVILDGVVDSSTIGLKKVKLKVIDIIKNKEFTGYLTDVKIQEKMKKIKWKENIEVYVNDTINVDAVVEKSNIPEDYTVKIAEDVIKSGNVIKVIINSTAGSEWEIGVPAKILEKPSLEYKNEEETTKELGHKYVASDIVKNVVADKKITDFRYKYELVNKIDTTTIGEKEAQFIIKDSKLNRIFDGLKHTVKVIEKMKDIKWNDLLEKYVGDKVVISDFINSDKIPENYEINLTEVVSTNESGEKEVKITVKNKVSGSIWNIKKLLTILPKPSLEYKDLWIYQNFKDKDKKGLEYINLMTVDLNKKYPKRYTINFVKAGDVSKIGTSEFKYLIVDKKLKREFEVSVNIEVRDEVLNPTLHNDVVYMIGQKPNVDDLVSNIDKDKYDISISNLNEIDINKVGEKNINISIISKETAKIFNYTIKVKYKVEYINLGILKWDQGKKLSINRIKEIKKLEEYAKLELIKPDILRSDKIEEYNVEIKLILKNGGYKIGKLKIQILKSKIIDEIDKIISDDKIQMISNIADVSSMLNNRLLNNATSKYNNFWLQEDNNYNKTIGDSNSELRFGGKLGYDRLLKNNKTILGAYVGYDNKIHNLSDKSFEHLVHLGMYSGHNINDNIYLGAILEYSGIFGKLKIKNISENIDVYNRNSHNILANTFVGYKKEYMKNSYISASIADSILLNLSENIVNEYDKISIKPNVSNEVYASIKVNRAFDKLNVYSELKAGLYISKYTLDMNGIVKKEYKLKDKLMGTFNIKGGLDYNINDNITIGAELGLGANTKKQIDVNGKLNMSYKFSKKIKSKVKEEVNYINVEQEPEPILKKDIVYTVGEKIDIDEIVKNIDKNKFYITIVNKDEIDINKEGNKKLYIKIISKKTNKEYEYVINLKYVKKEISKLIVNFDFDSYILKEEYKEKIKEFLLEKTFIEIVIKGYTDKIGSDVYNKNLSEKRAEIVYNYINKIIKSEARILYYGMGKSKPISNINKKNRRTEINIVY